MIVLESLYYNLPPGTTKAVRGMDGSRPISIKPVQMVEGVLGLLRDALGFFTTTEGVRDHSHTIEAASFPEALARAEILISEHYGEGPDMIHILRPDILLFHHSAAGAPIGKAGTKYAVTGQESIVLAYLNPKMDGTFTQGGATRKVPVEEELEYDGDPPTRGREIEETPQQIYDRHMARIAALRAPHKNSSHRADSERSVSEREETSPPTEEPVPIQGGAVPIQGPFPRDFRKYRPMKTTGELISDCGSCGRTNIPMTIIGDKASCSVCSAAKAPTR